MPIGPVRNVQKQVLLYNSCQKTMHCIAGLLGLSLQIMFWDTVKNCNLAVDNKDALERKFPSQAACSIFIICISKYKYTV